MAFTLQQLRRLIQIGPVHADGFPNEKLDICLQSAGDDFAEETKLIRAVSTVAVASGDSTVSIVGTLTDFEPGHLTSRIYLSTTFKQLTVVPLSRISALREETSNVSGTPELIAFQGNTVHIFPKADAAYTLNVPHWQTFTSWTIGTMGAHSATPTYRVGDVVDKTSVIYRCILEHSNQTPPNTTYWEVWSGTATAPGSVTFNVKDQYLRRICEWGARAYLILGAPGHPDGPAAMQKYEQWLAGLKGSASMLGTVYDDPYGSASAVYAPQGAI